MIKVAYKKRMGEHNEELLRQELAERDREMQELRELYETVRAANHSMQHRQAAVERRVEGILEKAGEFGLTIEAHNEISAALAEIRSLKQEYKEKVDHLKVQRSLPSTNVPMIDDLFGLFAERFEDSGIDFKLKVNGSVVYMVEHFISQAKLETIIGDHLQNALIAVSAADSNSGHSVLAVIGEAEDCYEFTVFDSGVPFTIDTLLRLGAGNITTHVDDGGTGIGFMTTFAAMKECAASLIIDENLPGGAFSKSVTIRFDSRNEYRIESYRADQIRAANKDGREIIIT